MINFDSALGIHPHALKAHIHRSKLLAANIANAETPNYKAQDLDFKALLNQVHQQPSSKTTSFNKTSYSTDSFSSAVANHTLYRLPYQASEDGNSVESHLEKSRFNETNMRLLAAERFLSSKFRGLRTAIKGE